MYKLFLTDGFQEWLDNIRDGMTKRPRFETIAKVVNVLGLRLTVTI